MKQRKSSISFRRERPGRTSKGCGASVCWRGVPEVEELWNTELAISEGRGSSGCVRKSPNNPALCPVTRAGMFDYFRLLVIRAQSKESQAL
jgi:hypothetical protein